MAPVAALTTDQKIQLAIAALAALAALIALVNVWITSVNERRRSQPIIVAHEERGRHFAPSTTRSMWAVDAYLTSDGDGAAFNVRFGVEFGGIRYPYKLHGDDPDAGNTQRVLRAGERRPAKDSWPILIASLSMWGRASEVKRRGAGELDSGRRYWARYENAQGETWETINPADRSARIHIRRVRAVRLREWRERRAREMAGRRDVEWEKRAVAELVARMDEAKEADTGPDETGAPPHETP